MTIIACVLAYHLIGAFLGIYVHSTNPVESYADYLVQKERYPGLKTYPKYCAISILTISVIWFLILIYCAIASLKKVYKRNGG